MAKALLEVRELSVDYGSRGGGMFRRKPSVRVLDALNLDVFERETLGLVGESGSGKSTLVNCILRLQRASSGRLVFDGTDLLALAGNARRLRRREIQGVFQNPYSSLDPRMRVADLVMEPLRIHSRLSKAESSQILLELLDEVGLSSEQRHAYPYELSGGQAQRVAIARALALRPRFIVLDEPTSALDVSVQAQVTNLLVELQHRHGLTYLFVSHDLALVSNVSARIAVMYMGQIVELGLTDAVLDNAAHPYTRSLLSSAIVRTEGPSHPTVVAPGEMPSFADPPSGCRFHTRCPFVMDICRVEEPLPTAVDSEHWAACHLVPKEAIDAVPSRTIGNPSSNPGNAAAPLGTENTNSKS